MHIKKVTKKDRYGNQVTTEYEVPEKSLDYTELLKKQMELGQPDLEIDMMSMAVPPVMGEEFNMGDPMNHPGEPKGSDTVPAWLTPGEFVVNKEATEMFGPEIEAMNEVGRMAKGGQVQYHADGAPVRGSAAQIMAGMDPAQIVRMMGNLGNAYQYLAPALGMNEGGDVPMPMSMTDALLHSREGFRDDVYLDSLGKPTVGYGHLLGSEYADKVGTTPFTQDELDSFFAEDRETAESAAKRNVGEDTWKKLNKRQKATLSSMAFQLGEKGQSKFKNMIKAIQNDDYREAAKQALTGSKGGKSRWLKQTPVRALDLAEAFDPDLAAQYRDAGGVVYDDMPVQYAFLGKLLGEPAEPTPEINWQGNAGMLSDLINAGYTPEQAIAAIKNIEAGEEVVPIEGELAAPPVAAPLEGDTVAKRAEEDLIDDFLWGAANPLDPFGFTRPEEEGGNEITWQDVGDVALGDKGRAALGMPELEQSPIDPNWWKGEALKDAEAAVQYDDEIGGVPSALFDEEEEAAAPPVPAYEEIEDFETTVTGGSPEDELTPEEIAALERQEELDAYTSGEDLKSWQKADQEKQAILKKGREAFDEERKKADAEAGGENPANKQSDSAVTNAGTNAMDNMSEDEKQNLTGQVREYLENSPLGEEIGGALGSFFNAGELTKMAVYVAGSMVFGATPMQAMNFGVQKYIGGLETERANAAKTAAAKENRMWDVMKNSDKFTPESLKNYKKTGNVAVLEPKPDAPTGKTLAELVMEVQKDGDFTPESVQAYIKSGGDPSVLVNRKDTTKPLYTSQELNKRASEMLESGKYTRDQVEAWVQSGGKAIQMPENTKEFGKITQTEVIIPGEGLRQVYETPDGQQYYLNNAGQPTDLLSSGARVYDAATMGQPAIKEEYTNWIQNEIGRLNSGLEPGDKGHVDENKTALANRANILFQELIRNSKVPVEDAEVVKAGIGAGINDYLAAKQAFSRGELDKKPTSLDAYVDARIISKVVGISPAELNGVSVETQYRLNERIRNDLRAEGVSDQQIMNEYSKWWQSGQSAWAGVPADARKKYEKRARKGENAFTVFMTDLINDKEDALKYLPQ